MKVNQTMNITEDEELSLWAPEDVAIFKEFSAASATFDPALPLPRMIAAAFAPLGPMAFRERLYVLAAALGRTLITDVGADAATVDGVVAGFIAQAEAEAQRMWLHMAGFDAEVPLVH